jgi:hypothetical protein
MAVKLAAAAAIGCAGCYNYVTDSFISNGFSGDEFPTYVDVSSGAIVVGVQPDGDVEHDAVLDLLSPLNLIDDGPKTPPSITYPGLTLLGEAGPGGTLDLPRAHFDMPQVVTLHPCDTDTCTVGTPTSPPAVPFTAVLGMPAFASDALRLHLDPVAPHVFILPDVAGDELHRSLACDAVMPSPFRGGGTLVIGGTEVSFTNWRIAIDTCLQPNVDPAQPFVPETAGTDALLVLSTGIGMSLLGESAYARYRQAVPTAPDLATLPMASVFLPSGLVTGHATAIPSLALVANSGGSPRGPCRQVYLSHVQQQNDIAVVPDTNACPCGRDSNDSSRCTTFCPVPAVIELAPPGQLQILIVPDVDPTLQALRAELRPDQPEVDGILGADALKALELDVDYPHDQLLGRCIDSAACFARPEISSQCERALTQECIGLPAQGPCSL